MFKNINWNGFLYVKWRLIFTFTENSCADSDHIASAFNGQCVVMAHSHTDGVEFLMPGKRAFGKASECGCYVAEVAPYAQVVVDVRGHAHDASDPDSGSGGRIPRRGKFYDFVRRESEFRLLFGHMLSEAMLCMRLT